MGELTYFLPGYDAGQAHGFAAVDVGKEERGVGLEGCSIIASPSVVGPLGGEDGGGAVDVDLVVEPEDDHGEACHEEDFAE